MSQPDSMRRDGRTGYSGRLFTDFGIVIAQNDFEFVIKRSDGVLKKYDKGSYRFMQIPPCFNYYTICEGKLVDYL